MAATVSQVDRLRRLVNEPDDSGGYTDAILTDYIERYPLLDELGEEPYTWDTSTSPPTQDDNTAWIPTYDLHAAAADVWEEKAAVVAADFDFSADGSSYSRQQKVDNYKRLAAYHRSRRRARSARIKDGDDTVPPDSVINRLGKD